MWVFKMWINNTSNRTVGGLIVPKEELSPFESLVRDARQRATTTLKTDLSLVWNVYYEDFNRRCISTYNIFKHTGFYEDCQKAAKQATKDGFREAVRRSLMYYFWSKCEWEIILTCWPPKREDRSFEDEKIDVYDQVMLNFDRFIDYLWSNRGVLNEQYTS